MEFLSREAPGRNTENQFSGMGTFLTDHIYICYRDRNGDRTGEVTDTSPPGTTIRSLESKFFFAHT